MKIMVTFLLWSQKYTKADMLYLARGGFWIGFGQAINGFLSLVLIIAFANLLPKETYGLYRYILSIAGILNIFTLTGMNSAVSRMVAKGFDGVLQPAVNYQLKWNMLMFTAFSILGGYYYLQNDLVLSISFFVLGIFVPLTLAFSTYSSFLEGKKEFRTANILSIISTFVYSLGILITLFVTDDVIWLVALYAITTFASSLFFYIYVLKKFKPPLLTDADDTLKFGRELTYLRLIDPAIAQIDKIVLGHFWGPAQLATYTLAQAIPNRATLFIKSWVTLGFPKFAAKTPAELNTVFVRRLIQGMALGALVAVIYATLSPYLFKYLLPQYLDGVFYSQLLAIGLIFAIPNRYMSLLFTSQGLSRELFKRTFIISLINIALYVILGIWGGLLGLVCANILSNISGFILNITMWLQIK